MKFGVVLEGVVLAPIGPSEVEKHLDTVMDELHDLGATDPAIEADLRSGDIAIHVVVEAADPISALNEASTLIRTCIHAAGGATPDWPEIGDGWGIQLREVRSGELVDV